MKKWLEKNSKEKTSPYGYKCFLSEITVSTKLTKVVRSTFLILKTGHILKTGEYLLKISQTEQKGRHRNYK